MSETELLDEVMQLRRSLCDIEEYEINWAVGMGENMAKVQLMAVTALNRPIPVAAPSPGTGAPVSTFTAPMGPLCEEVRAAGRYCYVTTYRDGESPIKTSLLFRTVELANECARRLRADPAVPAAEPGKPAHDWTSAPGIGWACEHCHSFRRVRGATELSRGFEYQPQNKRKWGPDEPPCAGAAEPGKPATCGGQCVKHGDEMHSVHEYEPGVAARWALQDNIGRCPYVVPPTPGKGGEGREGTKT